MYYGPYTIKGYDREEEVVSNIITAANKWADNLWVMCVLDGNGNIIPEDVLKEIVW